MINLEPHFLAVVAASEAIQDVLDLLPESDLIDELRHMNDTQLILLSHIVEGKHYGSDNLINFMKYIQTVKNEIARIQDRDEI